MVNLHLLYNTTWLQFPKCKRKTSELLPKKYIKFHQFLELVIRFNAAKIAYDLIMHLTDLIKK